MHPASTALALLLASATAAQATELVGSVRGPGRTPAPGTSVTVRWRSHPELPGLCGHTLGNDGVSTKTVTSDERGRFRIALPVSAPFEILAQSADGSLAMIRRFPVVAGGFIECQLVETPWIGGSVTDADNEPVPDFDIAIIPFQQTWARHRGCASPMTRYQVTTDKHGKWRCIFPSGYLKESFWEPYLVAASADPRQLLGSGKLLMPERSCQQLELTVTAAPIAKGVVVDALDNPIAGARVFDPLQPNVSVRTNDTGHFEVPTTKPDSLHAAASGWCMTQIPKGKQQALRVQLPPAPTVAAVLRDRKGRPLASHAVLWCDRWGPSYASYAPLEHATTTDKDGKVTLGGEGLGTKTIGFVAVDDLYVPFFAPAGKPTQEITITPRALSGTILDANSVPIAAARITARSRDTDFEDRGDPLWVTYSDHGGRFRFASLPPGPLILVADARAAGFAKAEVKASAVQADLQTGAEEALELEVLDANEKPCPSAWVTLTGFTGIDQDIVAASPSGGAALIAFTDANGKVAFRGVPDAQWFALAMRLIDGKIEATELVPLQRGTVTRVELAEHKR